uniref:Uncharacterized protein n=1 Tax=Rhizophora mucronata TaxID=61149 RepID=A0A2P2QWW3_RHIMU
MVPSHGYLIKYQKPCHLVFMITDRSISVKEHVVTFSSPNHYFALKYI